jgi:molecular chaperone DnaK (HSP70)
MTPGTASLSPPSTGDGAAPARSRYVVGIDLGTTNSALAYVDTAKSPRTVETFLVPQLVAAGTVEALEVLPSFHYEPAGGEFAAGQLRLPGRPADEATVVGRFARDHGTQVPARLVASAKSWLCHSGVDRQAELLPWQAPGDVTRLSPVEVSARYLGHLRMAWDAAFPGEPLAAQEIALTLPASFDEIARELTVQAARKAGLARVVLIEEPQAAFYAWLHKQASDWSTRVQPGQTILVVDIGGGTSDFTLIRVRPGEGSARSKGVPRFHRVAVGEHLILGGDNLDLALAKRLEERMLGPGKTLDPERWGGLLRRARDAKERLLADNAPETLTITLGGGGTRLIGGGLRCEVTRDEVEQWLVEGFLPLVDASERPERKRSGFQELGLPYAPDPAISRHLAAFLAAHAQSASNDPTQPVPTGTLARPDVLLLNGGFFHAPKLAARLIALLQRWFRTPATPDWSPLVLDHDRLDLAVARGAAYYGLVRRGEGVAISAALPRSYYLGTEDVSATGEVTRAALCVMPAGTEAGAEVDLAAREFDLRVGQPVEFPIYVSSTRLIDPAGAVVAIEPEAMTMLPPVRTVLQGQRKSETGTLRVRLQSRLTEIGTLDLWCAETEGTRRWKLQFDVRAATETDVVATGSTGEAAGILDETRVTRAQSLILETFSDGGAADPESLMKRLGEALELSREEWPAVLLRRLWEAALERVEGRRLGPNHEARWLNLVGFALRPGYGVAADEWRVGETRRLLGDKLVQPSGQGRSEWWILWRRLAGGLTSGQQLSLVAPQLAQLKTLVKQPGKAKSAGAETVELIRLLASCERLPLATKSELGQLFRKLVQNDGGEFPAGWSRAALWGLGRVGARVLQYGPLNLTLGAEQVAGWVEGLLARPGDEGTLKLTLVQLARRTGDRYRDLPAATREQVLEWLATHAAPAEYLRLVAEGGPDLDSETRAAILGDSLPTGLTLRR